MEEMKKIKPGDSNHITREYFDSLLLEMRHLDGSLPDTKLELFGERFSTPVMTAALSHLDNVRENGMAVMAEGAHLADAVSWAGMGDEEELEKITGTGARTVKIIKPYKDNAYILKRIAHVEKCGAMAVGMDMDHAFSGNGSYDVVCGMEMRPKSAEELKEFVRATSLPFVVKGVLSVKDAVKCLEAGVKGIVVSHHHGIMDYAVPPLLILPEIARAVQKQIPIFVDCGVESGADVFKALALGADAVCVGRALMGPLRENGAQGVREKIVSLTEELAGMMARTGSPDLVHIDPSVIWKR